MVQKRAYLWQLPIYRLIWGLVEVQYNAALAQCLHFPWAPLGALISLFLIPDDNSSICHVASIDKLCSNFRTILIRVFYIIVHMV